MAKVTKISYRRGITLNVGDFESVRVDIEAEAEVEDGESFDDAFTILKEQVDESVRTEARSVRNKSKR